MNIQDYMDAILLASYGTQCADPKKNITGYIYHVKSTNMLYEVASDGTVVGQKYILDVVFDKVQIK